MLAIILAAGQGTRLAPWTEDRPKCLVPVRGRPILEYALDALRAGGIGEIAVVTGYRAETIRPYGLLERHNPEYDRTNMVHSLFCAEDLMENGFLIVYGDILFSPRYVRALLKIDAPFALAINTAWRELWKRRMEDPLQDAETLKIDKDGNIAELGRKPESYEEIEGQFTGLVKVAGKAASQVREFYHGLDREARYENRSFENMFMTAFLQEIIDRLMPIRAVPIDGGWAEIDAPEDLRMAEELEDNFFA